MLSTSPARIALHAELAALADAFFAARAPVEAVEAVEPSKPSAVTCDGSLGWASRYLGAPIAPVAFPHRLALTLEGTIEATAFNRDYPGVPFRVVIERRAPGNVIEANVPEGSDTFRYLVRAARQHVAI